MSWLDAGRHFHLCPGGAAWEVGPLPEWRGDNRRCHSTRHRSERRELAGRRSKGVSNAVNHPLEARRSRCDRRCSGRRCGGGFGGHSWRCHATGQRRSDRQHHTGWGHAADLRRPGDVLPDARSPSRRERSCRLQRSRPGRRSRRWEQRARSLLIRVQPFRRDRRGTADSGADAPRRSPGDR